MPVSCSSDDGWRSRSGEAISLPYPRMTEADRIDADLAVVLEGGHSRRRVVHAGGSATGRRVVRQLSAVVVETPGVTVIEGARAARLWTRDGRCVGVVCEDGRKIRARAVVLATGG